MADGPADEPETHVVEDVAGYGQPQGEHDAGFETGSDAGSDAGADAGSDAGSDAAASAYQAGAPLSFDDALAGREAQASPQSFEPNSYEPQPSEAAAPAEVNAPPSFDVTQPWESQLRAQADAAPASPFAPVTQPAEGAPASGEGGDMGDVPTVAAAEEGEEAPFTPPSSRMFNDLYGQQNPEQGH